MPAPLVVEIECTRCPATAPVVGAPGDRPGSASSLRRMLSTGWGRTPEGMWICPRCLDPLLSLETG